jgi:dCTP deaminase
MIVNGSALLNAAPINAMLAEKHRAHGVSYGLSEAGYDIRIKQDVLLDGRRRFTLASAIEEFDMPGNLVGIVHDKSTWARRGLSVFNTVIESGWRGWLTLELVYHGGGALHIPAGAGIAQVLFHETAEPAYYRGKYQNQADMPVEARYE